VSAGIAAVLSAGDRSGVFLKPPGRRVNEGIAAAGNAAGSGWRRFRVAIPFSFRHSAAVARRF